MSVEEMIQVLDDPDRKLGWQGTPAGPELEDEVSEWAYGVFAGWETDRQIRHLVAVGVKESADILTLADVQTKALLLSLLPDDFGAAVEDVMTDSAFGLS